MNQKKPKKIFTTTRISNGHIFNLPLHLQRLKKSAETINIKYQLNEEALKQEIITICKQKSANTRLKIITDGKIFELSTSQLHTKINTLSGEIETKSLTRPFPQAKYVTNLYQDIINQQSEKIIETIFFNEQDIITEGNITNIFAVYDEIILTPPREICLPGIMRANLISFLKREQIKYQENTFTKNKLKQAKEIILTNSIKGIIKVTKWQEWQSQSNEVHQKIITALPFDF